MIEPTPHARSGSHVPSRAQSSRDGLLLSLLVQDPESLAALQAIPEEGARREHALRALRIGLLALQQAQGQIDVEGVRREGERLVREVGRSMESHRKEVALRMEETLKRYFDPSSGAFSTRVQRLVERDGDLERVLRAQIGAGESELAQTLRAWMGAESPLMKVLSPTDSEGLLAALRGSVEAELTTQREQILGQFSLDQDDSALSRLVGELQRRHGDLTTALAERIDGVVQEFSLDSDESALSKLVRRVETANAEIHQQFSLDREDSALARMRTELMRTLREQQEQETRFRNDVLERLGKMEGTREEAFKSTRHGLTFESALFHLIQQHAQAHGDVATDTGATTGLIRNRKTGDATIELGPDCVASGARIVIEAKQDAGYTLEKARAEIDEARRNRGADVGVFVFSARSAPEGLDRFQRLGSDVFVVWDAESDQGDVWIEAALTLARALLVRSAREREGRETDLAELNRSILEIEKQSNGLDDIDKFATTIQNSSEKILHKVGVAKRKLLRQVRVLRELLEDLERDVE